MTRIRNNLRERGQKEMLMSEFTLTRFTPLVTSSMNETPSPMILQQGGLTDDNYFLVSRGR